ncbi:MAG TPA: Fe-S-containing protein [bacterium]|nr:Fe-S-containing protein [bacterium]
MIEAAGITLRESIEAILVLFIMAAYLDRTDESPKKKFVYTGAMIAVGLSVLLAIVLSSLGINPENEVAEGILFFIAGILVASLTIWMMRHARHFKGEIEQKLSRSTSGLALATVAFVMVFREGAETVIFLQSLLLSGSTPVENFAGGLLGITLALLFGFVFLRGTARINLKRFFNVTAVILGVLVFHLIANGFHEFFETELLPSTEGILTVVGFLSKASTSASIIAIMLLALVTTVLYDLLTSPRPEYESLKPAERRKAQYDFMKEKYTKVSLASVVTIAMVTLLTPTIIASDVAVPPPATVEAHLGTISIAKPHVEGLHRYQYQGKRIMVAVDDAGDPHVALDYCYICPPTGYGYDGETLICLNCGAPIEIGTVGNPGGCNPRVIDYTETADSIKVAVDEVNTAWGE